MKEITTRPGSAASSGWKYVRKTLFVLVALAVTAIMLMPFGWIIGTSMRQPQDSFRLPPTFFPTKIDLTNYRSVFTAFPFFSYTGNSLFVTVMATSLMIAVTSMAAFAFARVDFRFKGPLYVLLISGMMIPAQSIIVPTFLIIRQMRLIDTLGSLIVTNIYYPVGLLLLRQSMMIIPKSYDEAAYCDGAGKVTIFLRVILPMSKGSLMVAFSMFFVSVWNDFFKPLIFINSMEKMTLPLGITMLNSTNGNANLTIITAGIVLSLIPPFLIFLIGQKYLMRGVMTSGLKS